MNPMHGIGFWHLSFDEVPRVRKEVEDVSVCQQTFPTSNTKRMGNSRRNEIASFIHKLRDSTTCFLLKRVNPRHGIKLGPASVHAQIFAGVALSETNLVLEY